MLVFVKLVSYELWPDSSGVEQRIENPRVDSSNLSRATTVQTLKILLRGNFFCPDGGIGRHAGLRNRCREA